MALTDKSDVLTRGVEDIIIKKDFVEKLNSGTSLRLKMGFDPSAPDIHLGHTVGLRKLRQLQELGHKVVLIVGDWTAQIGDPSGRSQTRKMLTQNEVNENAKTYLDQFFKIIDKDKTEIRRQSEWFGDFNLTNVIELTSKFTVAQILARDDFNKRFKDNHPIAITELMYPLLQAYDSVAIESDVEFGGSDQRFNLLVGRELQQSVGMSPQQCFIMPILPGTDGKMKMSKSLDNYIGITESPNDMFGKIMSIPDELIIPYFELLTDTPTTEITETKKTIEDNSGNPMDLKKQVASIIVNDFHDKDSSIKSRNFFEETIQKKNTPEDIPEYVLTKLSKNSDLKLANVLVETKLASSITEARRLIGQGAVKLNDNPITENIAVSHINTGVLKVGRRRYLRLT
ncbi:MAG: tyrosine--tRNA ligase [Chloroflexi bacterium]|nr:tyrosine--tRNA ligase [Chloroflexota bacterium]